MLREKQFSLLSGKYKRFKFVHPVYVSINTADNLDSRGLRRTEGQLQRKYKLLSYERDFKMLKNDICITVIGQAVFEIFHFKVDIPRKSPRIIMSLNVSIKSGEQ